MTEPNQIPSERVADDYDRLRRRVLWKLPTGLYAVGSRSGGRVNLMTASWVCQMATQPKLVGVGVEASALTCRLIDDGGVFAVSVFKRGDRALVRRFVKPVEDREVSLDEDGRGTIREVAVASASTGAPILVAAVAFLDCERRHSYPMGSHTWFVGEVVDCGFGPDGEDEDVLRM
ncbi:MAG TPA: flavin reductase family protein, partial [Acidimicrobiales bacterium]|nr:flavin reductase family protein [Acidimicrobiales bacterium]